MTLRILIVDDHAEFRTLLRHHISLRWPSAELTEHDPAASPLAPDFGGGAHDIVLLDYQLGTAEDGFDYLRRFRARPAFPPVIMLTAAGNEELAVRAIKGGAADYIAKQTMTHERLTSAIAGALESGRPEMPSQVPPDARPPEHVAIPGYRLDRCLAEGGVASVFLATELATKKPVVVKIILRRLPSGEESREVARLQREHDLIRKVDSPRIVRLHDLGLASGHVYLVMEYFPSGSLRQQLAGPIPRAQALDYVRQIAQALEIIHRAGILHRDLKPANVMLRRDGSLALIDFGAAKDIGAESDLTRTGTVIGTPQYMSPEQCGAQPLSPASDLYSVGIMLHEMLTGQLPYTASTPLAILYKHQYAPLPLLPEPLADLQPLLDTLLAKTPDERYPRARELLAALGAITGQPAPA